MTIEVSATGTLQPLIQVEHLQRAFRRRALGFFDENQRVKKGDVLAELDTAQAARADRARGGFRRGGRSARSPAPSTTLEESRAARSTAPSSCRRAAWSPTRRARPPTLARDRADSALANAQATLAIAKAELKSATDRPREEHDLRADRRHGADPLGRSGTDGGVFAAGAGAVRHRRRPRPAWSSRPRSTKPISAACIPASRRRFTVDAFSDRRFTAKIRDISYASVTTEGVVTYDAELDVDNAELLLRPGMTATVDVVAREAKGVLTVPAAALPLQAADGAAPGRRLQPGEAVRAAHRQARPARAVETAADGTRAVYLLRNGHPVETRVKAGATDGERVEILSGLNAGRPSDHRRCGTGGVSAGGAARPLRQGVEDLRPWRDQGACAGRRRSRDRARRFRRDHGAVAARASRRR